MRLLFVFCLSYLILLGTSSAQYGYYNEENSTDVSSYSRDYTTMFPRHFTRETVPSTTTTTYPGTRPTRWGPNEWEKESTATTMSPHYKTTWRDRWATAQSTTTYADNNYTPFPNGGDSHYEKFQRLQQTLKQNRQEYMAYAAGQYNKNAKFFSNLFRSFLSLHFDEQKKK